MREPTDLEHHQYKRLQEIFALGRQRYLQSGGDPRLSGGSLNDQDFLTEAEKEEIRSLSQQLFQLNRETTESGLSQMPEK